MATIENASEIDVDALTRRYAEERLKRLRPEGIDQYQGLTGKFAAFAEDPHADPDFERAALTEDVEVLIVGGGFAGLLAGAHLVQAGITDIRIVEKGADFGGTWYWNRYPGAACDVESYIYMPLLEEVGALPSERYAKAPEIFAHAKKIAAHFGLYDGALFQTGVREMSWDEQRHRWLVRTDRDDVIAARFVVSCTGLMSSPKLPGIPGIETFEGHSFHTSRWDYAYTGGDERGGLVGLKDKRVAIIGTGSTGIQCIPHLGEWAEHLYVFQRTPSSINVRGNRPTDPDWAQSLTPGWQRERVYNFTKVTAGIPESVDMVADSWTDIFRDIPFVGSDADAAAQAEALLLADLRKMEGVRQRIADTVTDPATAEALKPYYNFLCKRPGFHDEYLRTFNRDNVTLVDTKGYGVERITPTGIVVAGHEYSVDCLVYATGFDFMTEYSREAGIAITGRNGRPLSEHWQEGARTLYGMQTTGFPNFFLMSLVQSGNSINYMHMADEQTRHIAFIVAQCTAKGITAIEPTEQAEEAWVDAVLSLTEQRRMWLQSCTPSYFNYEGKRGRAVELNDIYAGGPMTYIKFLEDWRASGDLGGMNVTYGGDQHG